MPRGQMLGAAGVVAGNLHSAQSLAVVEGLVAHLQQRAPEPWHWVAATNGHTHHWQEVEAVVRR